MIIFMALLMQGCAGTMQFQAKHYSLDHIVYNIADGQIRQILESEKAKTAFKPGQQLDGTIFEKERDRIESVVQRSMDPEFDKKRITFVVDTTLMDDRFSVIVNL